MKILSIDTSCDDTSIAIIEAKKAQKRGCFKILSNVVSSQVKLHQEYGGVYPSLAKREHQKNLVPVLEKALRQAGLLKNKTKQTLQPTVQGDSCSKTLQPTVQGDSCSKTLRLTLQGDFCLEKILNREAELHKKLVEFFQNYKKPDVDVVAVTIGPGLEPCLWAGVNFAKTLSFYWNLPIIPVNHIEGHILVNLLSQNNEYCQKMLPAVCLIVSGGHTQLVFMKKIGKYKIIGETRDDAAGECFDKTARILGLSYPGGPEIAKQAAKITPPPLSSPSKRRRIKEGVQLPRPMLHSKDYDFSFSGLKTAVLYDFKKRTKKQKENKDYIRAMAKEIQQAIIDVLIKKTVGAAKEYKAKTIILGGGVAANRELRRQFQQKIKKEKLGFIFHVSCFKLCTDNAAMIGIAAWFHQSEKQAPKKLKAKSNLRI